MVAFPWVAVNTVARGGTAVVSGWQGRGYAAGQRYGGGEKTEQGGGCLWEISLNAAVRFSWQARVRAARAGTGAAGAGTAGFDASFAKPL